MIGGMKAIQIREFTTDEKEQLEKGLRSSSAYTVRCSQMLLSNAEGRTAPRIAQDLHCSAQSVRRAIHGFNNDGPSAIYEKSRRPHCAAFSFNEGALERLKDITDSSPRDYGQEHSLWSLERLAEVCKQKGLTERKIGGTTMSEALRRAGINWKRARKRLRSTDEAYEEKKSAGIT